MNHGSIVSFLWTIADLLPATDVRTRFGEQLQGDQQWATLCLPRGGSRF
jgi:hypothetical protein